MAILVGEGPASGVSGALSTLNPCLLRAIMACNTYWTQHGDLACCIARNKQGSNAGDDFACNTNCGGYGRHTAWTVNIQSAGGHPPLDIACNTQTYVFARMGLPPQQRLRAGAAAVGDLPQSHNRLPRRVGCDGLRHRPHPWPLGPGRTPRRAGRRANHAVWMRPQARRG